MNKLNSAIGIINLVIFITLFLGAQKINIPPGVPTAPTEYGSFDATDSGVWNAGYLRLDGTNKDKIPNNELDLSDIHLIVGSISVAGKADVGRLQFNTIHSASSVASLLSDSSNARTALAIDSATPQIAWFEIDGNVYRWDLADATETLDILNNDPDNNMRFLVLNEDKSPGANPLRLSAWKN